MRTLETLRKMRKEEFGTGNGEGEKADGKCQMADDGCRTGDDGVASGECRVASEEKVASGQWSVASESGESGEPMQEEGRSLQNVPNEANLESTQSSLLLEVESSTTEPEGQKRSQFTQAVASEDGVASGEWPVASEIGVTVNPKSAIQNPKSQGECRAPQNVQNEANPESTQSSLPLEVESSEAEPAGRKRSQFTQAVASGERRVAREQKSVVSEREAGETAAIEGRQKRHHFL